MLRGITWTLGLLVLTAGLVGCCADPCDPLCPGDPCDSRVGPCDPCVCRTGHRAVLVPKSCCFWGGCVDPCDDSSLDDDPCYRDPAEGIGDTPMTIPGVPSPTIPVPTAPSPVK